ncbi:MAG: DUF58 domain-containing protein [Nodosilinea sp.]
MTMLSRLSQGLERRWVNPAYGGWVLLGLAIFFFAAATNTLAGWLYVMSGVMLALLAIAAVLPPRNLSGLDIQRQPIQPVSAGEPLLVELHIHNTQRQPKGLFQVIDPVPARLGSVQRTAIGAVPPGQDCAWRYDLPTARRGVYRWQTVDLRSAAPLGLFWCRRKAVAPALAMVYPQILPLQRCPLVDTLSPREGQQWHHSHRVQPSTEGVTRALRPYRWGDPTRLIHWRTSARYGELRVRELEKVTASQEVILALNTVAPWASDDFEQAVIAAASLYSYLLKRGFAAVLWLPQLGFLRDYPGVLSALAAVEPAPKANGSTGWPQPLSQPLVGLTTPTTAPPSLPPGSRLLIWGQPPAAAPSSADSPMVWIDAQAPLSPQLQG